ncbi:hypothetical protein BH23CHL2_BH23CHL2_21010 [soil metagenome]
MLAALSARSQRIAGLVAVLTITQLIFGLPALAADSVLQQVSGGTRTASISEATMSGLTYSHNSQSNDHNLNLTVDDSSGTGEGWNVTVQSSNFVYSGLYNGADINASAFEIITANSPAFISGQAIDGANGPMVPASNSTGSLDVARKVLHANAGYGQGSYSQTIGVRLTVPGTTRAGSYTSSMTVTIASGP